MRNATLPVALSIAISGAFLVTATERIVGALGPGALATNGTAIAQEVDEGYQPWGTWAWSTHRPAGGSFPALITYHKDGTLSGSDGLMYGIDFPPALNITKMSLLHGVWERTGPQSFRGTSLWMQYAPNGNVIAWGRARSDLRFAGDPDHVEGMMYLDSLPCPTPFTCPDPITATWTPAITVRAVSATRLTRVEPPGM